MEPVGESNREIKDGVPIPVAVQACYGFAWLPALGLLGLILRFTDTCTAHAKRAPAAMRRTGRTARGAVQCVIDGAERPIDLSSP